jgi:RNA polymerase sigma-70 factor, ECF subfamily
MTRRIASLITSKEEAADDSALAESAAHGDERAFETLVRRHTPRAWRFARAMLSNDLDAEEAVQDTLVKAHRSLHNFRGDSRFGTWLLAICRRACLDRLRSRRPATVSLDRLDERPSEDHGNSVDLRVVVEQTLKQLPDELREAFVLVHVLDFRREEAAQICDVPPSTMRDRVIRARYRLAAALIEEES